MISWIKKRMTLHGRATRREHAITTCTIAIGLFTIRVAGLGDLLGYALIPSLIAMAFLGLLVWIVAATQVRRLHDIGVSGWWWLALGIPLVGEVGYLLLLFLGPDKYNQTSFYPNPRAIEPS